MADAAVPYQIMPPPSQEDRAALEASIIEHGVLVPVEYDEAGHILDGHTRVEICESLGLVDWPRLIRSGLTEPQKRSHARQLNCARRHLSADQKRALIDDQLRDAPSLSDRAIAAMLSVHHETVGARRRLLVSGGEIRHHEKRRGRNGVDQPVKTKPIKTMYVPEPSNRRAYLDGAKLIRTADQAQKRTSRLDVMATIAAAAPVGETAQLPRGHYSVIYADPPWTNAVYSDETGRDRDYPYPTMDTAQICALCAGENSPARADAVLFLWTTANRIDVAIDVIRAWGFDYKSQIIWDKINQGTGRWVRDCHEVLCIATRGTMPAPLPGTQPQSIFREKKGAHSQKPAAIAAMIDALYPGVAKLEMFARASALQEGDVRHNGQWALWGFEAFSESSLQGADAPSRFVCESSLQGAGTPSRFVCESSLQGAGAPSLPRKGADAHSGFGGEHSKRDGASGPMAGSHAAHGDETATSDGASGLMAVSHAAHGDETNTNNEDGDGAAS